MEEQSGEALALLGPSGSAKSLFLRLLNLLGTVCRGPGSTSGFKAAPLTLAQARIVRCPHSQFTMAQSHLFFC